MTPLSPIELELHPRAERLILDIPLGADTFQDLPQRGQGLGQPIRRRTPRQPFQDDICWGSPMPEQRGNPDQLIPLLHDHRQVHCGTKDGVERTIRGGPTHFVQLLILQVCNPPQGVGQ